MSKVIYRYKPGGGIDDLAILPVASDFGFGFAVGEIDGDSRTDILVASDFIARLATLMSKPGVDQTRYCGVFTPNSRHRRHVTLARCGKGNPALRRVRVNPAYLIRPRNGAAQAYSLVMMDEYPAVAMVVK